MNKQMGLLQRLLIFGTGIGGGCISMMGNVMMGDSGTKPAQLSATTGIIASISFIVGGTVGAFHHTWYGLLPGTILQVAAFAISALPPVPSSNRTLQETNHDKKNQ